MTIHIVLIAPKMPSNTGNIIRLCANSGAQLHLVRPLGFELDDKKLRRAGLDYHEYAHLKVHDNWLIAKQSLLTAQCEHIVALTTKLSHPFYDYDFTKKSSSHVSQNNIALIFGSETAGLSDDIRTDIGAEHWLRLPMLPDSRSLNLSNSVAICLYEVWRQQGFVGDEGRSTGYETLSVYDTKE
nr:tRNA (cytidine(34)-2'-O)-methyltransferase [uncultured Psychrobacter sp.]